MKLPKLRDLVARDKPVYFSFYRDGELWYKAKWTTKVEVPSTNGVASYTRENYHWFEFPIPPEDMKGALFKAEDKSVLFMRFIRKHLEFLEESMKSEGV